MKRQRIESSHIKSIGYDPLHRTLEIEFKGGQVYQYRDVPQAHYQGLMDADSAGEYHHKFIKDYATVRMR